MSTCTSNKRLYEVTERRDGVSVAVYIVAETVDEVIHHYKTQPEELVSVVSMGTANLI